MPDLTPEQIRQAFVLAKKEKPAYREIYPVLEPLFLRQAELKKNLDLAPLECTPQMVKTKWEEGFPLLQRWDFPFDPNAARSLLDAGGKFIPESNQPLMKAHRGLVSALDTYPDAHRDIWASFLQHEWEPWDEWVETAAIDTASLLFWARNCLRPQIEWSAEQLLQRHPLPSAWLKGYCPVCGSLPGFLHLEGKGERRAHCSWCGTEWGLYRLQCPVCDNRAHESLGYLYAEQEPQYRAQYCRLCKHYFKLIDMRELVDPVCIPLEEWTTIHLDLLAQKEGWQTPPSPAPTVYGRGEESGVGG